MQHLRQVTVCEWAKAIAMPPAPGTRVGIALATLGRVPINGMRVHPTEGTNGWYIWGGGEPSLDPDFYQPLCIEHLPEHLPQVLEYLDLPPGYRFLIDGDNYEDVWFDEQLATSPV